MKVVIVNAYDADGGAAKASYRLHRSLLKAGVDCKMVVQNKKSDDYTVLGPVSKFERLLNRIRPFLDSMPFRFYTSSAVTLFSASWVPSQHLINRINSLRPDIVHLHWINGGMIKIEDLAKIKAPIVWSLHDMWPLRGGWHYDEGSATRSQTNFSKKIFSRKLKTYSKIKNMTVVGLSRWLQESAKASEVFKGRNVVNLPNPIDTNIYKQIDKKVCRKLWGLPADKKLILFGALGATSDPRKGFKELTEAIGRLRRDDIELVVLGASTPLAPTHFECSVRYIGVLSDDISLVTIYNSVDVVLVPSLQENLSNAIMESLACGTPVVGFNIGGNSDLIDHRRNGYLADSIDTRDLSTGIEWVLDHKEYEVLRVNAREKVIRNFDSEVVANKYIVLYREIING